MLLDPKKTTVAYRCPYCGCGVLAPVGVFSLTSDRMRLNCACKQSHMDIARVGDDKIRLSTPCLACGATHSHTVSNSVFFGKDIFALNCTVSGLDIAFFGEQDKVSEALNEQERTLRELVGQLEEYEGEDEDYGDTDGDFNNTTKIGDAEIYNIIKFILVELAEDGKITCGCDTHGDYDAECTGDRVKVYCKKCGRFKYYPIDSVREAEKFLKIDEINL